MLFKNNISEIATKHHGNWYEPNELRKESETDAFETPFCCLFQYCEKEFPSAHFPSSCSTACSPQLVQVLAAGSDRALEFIVNISGPVRTTRFFSAL